MSLSEDGLGWATGLTKEGRILPQVLIFVFDVLLSIATKRSLAALPPEALGFLTSSENPIA
jgi:hypothetical protein